jgi:PAS domain S-box-containing protein
LVDLQRVLYRVVEEPRVGSFIGFGLPTERAGVTTRIEENLEAESRDKDEIFRLLVEGVVDYAIFVLSPEGIIMTWNAGAERIKGYSASEIIGQHFSCFYTQEAKDSGWPERELELAAMMERFGDEGWRVRKDGTQFWASVVITALRSPSGELRGFSKVTRDLTERRALEERTQELNKELRGKMTQLTESRSQLELQNIELQRLSNQLVRIQDEERRRIARELHDDLGQVLTALKINLDTTPQFPSRSDAISLTQDALTKVRNLSYLMHPPLLDESGLLAAMHVFLQGFQRPSPFRQSGCPHRDGTAARSRIGQNPGFRRGHAERFTHRNGSWSQWDAGANKTAWRRSKNSFR